MREFIVKWYNRIPKIHRDLPLVELDGKVYSPRRVYEEVMKGTELGERLQEKLESGSFTTDEFFTKLAKIRLIMVLKKLPKDIGIATFNGVYSRDELIKLIEEGKGIGKDLIDTEVNIIKEELGI